MLQETEEYNHRAVIDAVSTPPARRVVEVSDEITPPIVPTVVNLPVGTRAIYLGEHGYGSAANFWEDETNNSLSVHIFVSSPHRYALHAV